MMRAISNALATLRVKHRAELEKHVADVDPNAIVGDAAVVVVFYAIGAYGLYATATTPRTTTMGLLGALGVVGIEVAMLTFAYFRAVATWVVYQRSEPTHAHAERVDGYHQGGDSE